MTALLRTVRSMADGTPPERDRVLDLLRATAIAVVVLGHWLLAVVGVGPDGRLVVANLLTVAPWTHPLTLVGQVMPVFFLVGGVVNARSWLGARSRGVATAAWVRGRAVRLLRPAVPLLGLWMAVAPAALATGVAPELVGAGSRAALVPLWFLAVYLVVVAATPLAVRAQRRGGLGAVAALAAGACLVDVLHLAGAPLVGVLNFLLVWGAAHQLGISWGAGALREPLARVWLVAVGAGGLVGLVGLAGYPVAAIGVDTAARSNTAPPSLLLVALTLLQAGVVLSAERSLRRLAARPLVWRVVVGVNVAAMTVYVWHLTVLVAVVGVALLLGAGGVLFAPVPLTAGWWSSRPLWVLGLGFATAAVVALLTPLELAAGRPGRLRELPAVLAAVAVAVAGIGAAVVIGVDRPAGLLGAAAAVSAAAALGALPGRAHWRAPVDPPVVGRAGVVRRSGRR